MSQRSAGSCSHWSRANAFPADLQDDAPFWDVEHLPIQLKYRPQFPKRLQRHDIHFSKHQWTCRSLGKTCQKSICISCHFFSCLALFSLILVCILFTNFKLLSDLQDHAPFWDVEHLPIQLEYMPQFPKMLHQHDIHFSKHEWTCRSLEKTCQKSICIRSQFFSNHTFFINIFLRPKVSLNQECTVFTGCTNAMKPLYILHFALAGRNMLWFEGGLGILNSGIFTYRVSHSDMI